MKQEDKELLLKDLCAINSDRWMSLEDLPNEEWKVIEGFEDRYSVSNYGRVKTIASVEWSDEHPNISEEEQVGMAELGMIWQKKALIDKACKWLRSNADNYCDNGGYGIAIESLLNSFRKAMEE